jgi:hypothetical protein
MSATTKVFWALKAFSPCADVVLEKALPELPPSTVRGSRKALQRGGVVKCVGLTADRKRRVWALAGMF